MRKLGRGLFWITILLVIVAAVCRVAFLKSWIVPDEVPLSSSVAPTLAGGDVVLMLTRGTPGFGDLVRCEDPQDATRFVVGRIVGLSHDEVVVKGRDLIVNGKRYNATTSCAEPYTTVTHPVSGSEVRIACDRVDLGGREHYRGYSEKPSIEAGTTSLVGEGRVFLLSDDRSYPDDSRTFGPVPLETCRERIVFRVVGKEGWGDERRRMTFVH
jgi:signal peptidase I